MASWSECEYPLASTSISSLPATVDLKITPFKLSPGNKAILEVRFDAAFAQPSKTYTASIPKGSIKWTDGQQLPGSGLAADLLGYTLMF